MGQFHQMRFPNEDEAYRQARDALLAAELDLRRQIERHERALRAGVLLPFRSADSSLHMRDPDGRGRLD